MVDDAPDLTRYVFWLRKGWWVIVLAAALVGLAASATLGRAALSGTSTVNVAVTANDQTATFSGAGLAIPSNGLPPSLTLTAIATGLTDSAHLRNLAVDGEEPALTITYSTYFVTIGVTASTSSRAGRATEMFLGALQQAVAHAVDDQRTEARQALDTRRSALAVAANGTGPEAAQANALLPQLDAQIAALAPTRSSQRYFVVLNRHPAVANSGTGRSALLVGVAGGLAGGALAAGCLCLAAFFDPYLRTRRAVEQMTGPESVLGTIANDGTGLAVTAAAAHALTNTGPVHLVATDPRVDLDALVRGFDGLPDDRHGRLPPFVRHGPLNADPSILRDRTGAIVVVVQSGTTKADDLVWTVRALTSAGREVSGVVLVGVPAREYRKASI